jgi:Zn-finger nucleic acid-binding protein
MSQHITTCPACRVHTLTPTQLQPLLLGFRCERCDGNWLPGENYYRWLAHPDRRPDDANVHTVGEPHDSLRAKLCAECGKLLSRYRVGHGVDFCIDRCATCGGIWLDQNEWELLLQHRLVDRLHLVFSTAWQAELLREQQERAVEDRLTERIGADGLRELKRIADWMQGHPHRAEMRAYLLEHAIDTPKCVGEPCAVTTPSSTPP